MQPQRRRRELGTGNRGHAGTTAQGGFSGQQNGTAMTSISADQQHGSEVAFVRVAGARAQPTLRQFGMQGISDETGTGHGGHLSRMAECAP